jgi:hypothetical protein
LPRNENGLKQLHMKYLPLLTVVLLFPAAPLALAWDGFDAETTDLVEVIPDQLPIKGDVVTLRDYDTDTSRSCTVESVRRNRRTIELVVRCPKNDLRTLVMEAL